MKRNLTEKDSILSQTIKTVRLEDEEQGKTPCRICFQSECTTEEKNSLISPCSCKGTLKYVHQTCLAIWMQKKIQDQQMHSGQHEMPCEICQTIIPWQIQIEFNLKICSDIEKKIFKHPFLFLWSLILWIFLVSFLGFMIFLLVENDGLIIFYSFSIVACLLLISIYLYFFLKFFMLDKRIKEVWVKMERKP